MPKFNRLRTTATMTLSVVILSFGGINTVLGGTASAVSDIVLVTLTNNQRAANGLQPLSWNGSLSQSAALKAQDMCIKDYWAHDSPDGLTPWAFMDRAGYPYATAGENLAKNYATDEGVITGWMNSPGHRENILKTSFTDIGIASVQCVMQGVQTTLVVAHYGSTGRQSVAKTPQAAAPKIHTTVPVQQPVTPVAQSSPAVKTDSIVQTSKVHKQTMVEIITSLQKLLNTSTIIK